MFFIADKFIQKQRRSFAETDSRAVRGVVSLVMNTLLYRLRRSPFSDVSSDSYDWLLHISVMLDCFSCVLCTDTEPPAGRHHGGTDDHAEKHIRSPRAQRET